MIETRFENPEDYEFDKNESSIKEYYDRVVKFFGEDIFLLAEEEQKTLAKAKVKNLFEANGVRIDLLSLRQRLDKKIGILKQNLIDNPDDMGIKKNITESETQLDQAKYLFEICSYA